MNVKAEDILDKALYQVKNGREIKQVLLTFGYPDSELESLLALAGAALSLPRKDIPKPSKQRKFLQAQPLKTFWWQKFKIKRLSFTASGLLLITLLAGLSFYTAAAVQKSLPGENLFSLKKAGEKLELLLTRDPDKRADYQLTIAKQRLQDAEKILAYPIKDPRLEAAALAELSSQTQDVVQSLKKTAAANLIAKKDSGLFNSLIDITQKQQTFLNTLKPQSPGQSVSASLAAAAEQNKNAIAEIKRLAAAVDDQTLVNLSPDPNLVAVSGVVDGLQNAKITVEKTTFYLTDDTLIKKDAKTVGSYALTLNSKVSISGIKTNSGNILAAEILILDEQTAATAVPQHQGDKPADADKKAPQPGNAGASPAGAATENYQNPNQASANFIPEDPRPQYAP